MIRREEAGPWAERLSVDGERELVARPGESQPHLPGRAAEAAAAPRRRNGAPSGSAAGGAALRDALESLRHTVRFLEELMASRQAEAERASSRAQSDLQDIRQRITWVEELAAQDRI